MSWLRPPVFSPRPRDFRTFLDARYGSCRNVPRSATLARAASRVSFSSPSVAFRRWWHRHERSYNSGASSHHATRGVTRENTVLSVFTPLASVVVVISELRTRPRRSRRRARHGSVFALVFTSVSVCSAAAQTNRVTRPLTAEFAHFDPFARTSFTAQLTCQLIHFHYSELGRVAKGSANYTPGGSNRVRLADLNRSATPPTFKVSRSFGAKPADEMLESFGRFSQRTFGRTLVCNSCKFAAFASRQLDKPRLGFWNTNLA
jgi:hypothetical protein